MNNPDLDRLGAARHVMLTTFRRDGSPVVTCVWVTREGDALFVLTHRGAGKVIRIQQDSRVQIAPSDAQGRPQGGASWATAALADDPDSVRRVKSMMKRRYGVQYPVLRALMKFRGRNAGEPVALRITDPQPAEGGAFSSSAAG